MTVSIDPSTETQAVRVPDAIVDFLDEALVGAAGTRNADLVPRVHRVSGWRVEADRETIACMFAEPFTPHLVESLEQNGWLAVTIEKIPSHETYQFKGKFLSAKPCSAEDIEACDRIRDRFGTVIPMVYPFDGAVARAFCIRPSLTIRFRLLEIYTQTPGPGAGRRLVPAEEPR
jgi:hypothetical protein